MYIAHPKNVFVLGSTQVHDLTIGVDFGSRIIEIGGEKVKLQIVRVVVALLSTIAT